MNETNDGCYICGRAPNADCTEHHLPYAREELAEQRRKLRRDEDRVGAYIAVAVRSSLQSAKPPAQTASAKGTCQIVMADTHPCGLELQPPSAGGCPRHPDHPTAVRCHADCRDGKCRWEGMITDHPTAAQPDRFWCSHCGADRLNHRTDCPAFGSLESSPSRPALLQIDDGIQRLVRKYEGRIAAKDAALKEADVLILRQAQQIAEKERECEAERENAGFWQREMSRHAAAARIDRQRAEVAKSELAITRKAFARKSAEHMDESDRADAAEGRIAEAVRLLTGLCENMRAACGHVTDPPFGECGHCGRRAWLDSTIRVLATSTTTEAAKADGTDRWRWECHARQPISVASFDSAHDAHESHRETHGTGLPKRVTCEPTVEPMSVLRERLHGTPPQPAAPQGTEQGPFQWECHAEPASRSWCGDYPTEAAARQGHVVYHGMGCVATITPMKEPR